jgi:hypothetical protein
MSREREETDLDLLESQDPKPTPSFSMRERQPLATLETRGGAMAISPETPPPTSTPVPFNKQFKVILTPVTSMTVTIRVAGTAPLECANECLDDGTYVPNLGDLKMRCKERASFEVEGKTVGYLKVVRNHLSIPDDI